jgi:acetylornithine deacetylase/succinyl-diaminopimelate desuccinylase-like protein
MRKMMQFSQEMLAKILDFAVEIQQIPSPTFDEAERATFVQQKFLQEGLADVSRDEVGNIYARLPGKGAALPLVISAHSDTVFPRQTDLQVRQTPERIEGPGIGDNSLGIAGLFGLLWAARAISWQPAGDIWLVVNVCEEGLGDLRGMRAVVDRLGDHVRGYIILEGMVLGHVYHRGLGVARYRITCRTQGGHSWTNFGRPSAIHELARIIPAIEKILDPDQRKAAQWPLPGARSSLNVGMFQGGTSVNTIASEASLELDLRSESDSALSLMTTKVHELVRMAERLGSPDQAVHFEIEQIGRRPSGEISLAHPLPQAANRALMSQGYTPISGVGSTDANIPLSRGIPAVTIGLTTGGGAHTAQEFINKAPLAHGMAQLAALIHDLEDFPSR